jgi:hypothetical protein
MISEKEFDVLAIVARSSFLKLDDFRSDQEFDHACEVARSLLSRNLLRTLTAKPFMRNHTGAGSRYVIAGKFELTPEGSSIVEAGTYGAYLSSLPRQPLWTLDRRLVVLGIIVGLIGVIAAVTL